jgi:hypothetical protein
MTLVLHSILGLGEQQQQHCDIVNSLLMSNEAHFHMSGYMNKRNWFWAAYNPCALHKHLLHSVKVTVWCAVSSGGIIGPCFFEDEEG